MIYIDMDGVLADFCSKAQEKFSLKLEQVDSETLFSTCCGIDFWRNLSLFSWSKKIIEIVELFDKKWCFLTKATVHDPFCMSGKMLWVKDHFPQKTRNLICVNDKKCIIGNQGRFLIDDLSENCDEWHQAGGKFFNWQATALSSDEEIEDQLNKLFFSLKRFFH